MNINNMIKTLLGGACEKVVNDSVPGYLSSKYDREGAAINLGEADSDDPRIMGALCKACLTDEEDVRLR